MNLQKAFLITFLGNYITNTVVAALVALVPASAVPGMLTPQYITFVVLAAIVVGLLAAWQGVRSINAAAIVGAIGFGVFYFTNSSLLVEFGIVAALNVMSTYAISHILLPIIYSFLPAPAPKYTKHLQNKNIARVMEVVDHLVHKKRKTIYWTISLITLIFSICFCQ